MTNDTVATPAVKAYQRLTSVIDRRLEEQPSLDATRFWLNQYHVRGTEIASEHGLTIFELVDAWVAWTKAIDAEREQDRKLLSRVS